MWPSTSQTRPPPVLKFLGVFDTIKAYQDANLYDISLIESVQNFRQALALNERRSKFEPEIWNLQDNELLDRASWGQRSFEQGWFLGTHSDLGGGNPKDGLSLYPFQWILSAARDAGLVLGFRPLHKPLDLLEDPRHIVFPAGDGMETSDNCIEITLENGIVVKMWQIRHHDKPQYRVQINDSVYMRWLYSFCSRSVFKEGRLLGYSETSTNPGQVGISFHLSS